MKPSVTGWGQVTVAAQSKQSVRVVCQRSGIKIGQRRLCVLCKGPEADTVDLSVRQKIGLL